MSGIGVAQCRVCNGCDYELQMATSTRQENGELRKKSRGELKLFQHPLLVQVLSFLGFRDLLEVSLVSSDFYFMSRDNVIWYRYNMARWLTDREQQPWTPTRTNGGTTTRGRLFRSNATSAATTFETAAVLQDATMLSESEAAKRVISLHARYSFTQFLDFTRRQEMARCCGLASFSVGARLLFASPVKLAIVGPSKVGKTACIRSFMGEDLTNVSIQPTIAFTRYQRTVKLVGDFRTEVTLDIFELSGQPCYESMRRFICRHCHAIGLCYDPGRKVTLVEAADIMMGIETALGPQPVVVCGLHRRTTPRAPPDPASAGLAAPATVPAAKSTSPTANAMVASKVAAPSLPPTASINSPSRRSSLAAAKGTDLCSPVSHSCRDSPNIEPSEHVSDNSESPQPSEVGRSNGHAMMTPPNGALRSPVVGSSAKPTRDGRTQVSEADAVNITVRGRGSIQCDLEHPESFFRQLLQSLVERLALGAMVTSTTIAGISEGVRMDNSSVAGPGGCGGDALPHSRPRQPQANKAVAQELLNKTMQPSPLDILLNRTA